MINKKSKERKICVLLYMSLLTYMNCELTIPMQSMRGVVYIYMYPISSSSSPPPPSSSSSKNNNNLPESRNK